MQTTSIAPFPPTAASRAPASQADAGDLAACRDALRHGSRTFLAASLLLPRAVRDPACALYAFCRLADDAVDGAGAAPDAVGRLRGRLARACAGDPMPTPADRALAAVVRQFAIPRALLEALLEGFEWDAEGRRYDTLDDLHAYAARVAGSVGAMMALLMGVRSPDAVARACDLGVAMQLSNIARDVGEDARNGRLYLPRAWLHEAGIEPERWLASPRFEPALGGVVRRILDAADVLYARVDAGVACLPLGCRAGINAARFLYADIGHEVARRGLDSVSQRAVVPAARKARLLVRAGMALFPVLATPSAAALPATQFLVDAVAACPLSMRSDNVTTLPQRGGIGRAAWVVALFEQLELREQGLQREPT